MWSLINVSAAAKLAFTTQPSGGNTAGNAFGTQPVVKIQDVSGNTVTNSTSPVTLAITVGTGASGAVLAGAVTANAVNGVATFSGLGINLAGTGYTLTASSPGLSAAISSSFDIGSSSTVPTLLSPANGIRVAGNSITYSWKAVPGASLYYIYASTSPSFSTIKFNKVVSTTSVTDTGYTNNGGTYYWLVIAWTGASWSPNSAVWSFVNGP